MAEFVDIDPNVRKAAALPGGFYGGPEAHDWVLGRLLPGAWQPMPGGPPDPAAGSVRPWTLLPGSLDEPLLLATDGEGVERCLSNVCTHRGSLLVAAPTRAEALRCPYHGRRFDLTGRCLGMPALETDGTFPGAEDHLAALPLETWGPTRFTALEPALPFDAWLAGWTRAVPDGLEPASWSFAPERSPAYEVAAAWTLYVDNYLEGLHIAHVHPELSRTLERGAYRTRLLDHGVLQIGVARDADEAIPGAFDREGRPIAALYGWFFPNVMLNVYAWGLSVNVVEPTAPDRSRIRYLTYVREAAAVGRGPGGDLDLVERQDHAVVESVQRGVRSRLARRGTYVPGWEDGVHHFHRMLAARWNADHGLVSGA